MNISRTTVLVGTALALGCVLAGMLVMKHQAARDAAASQARAVLRTQPKPAESHPNGAAPAMVTPAIPEPLARTEAPAKTDSAPSPPAKPTAPSATAPKLAKPVSPDQDPLARQALSLVGVDPVAEAYWIDAINDTSLPADERQNLIEDLNEDGLSDTKLPTIDDLPLIVNRLLLIEDLAPNAMDDANFEAFQEAYKDLLNLAEVAMGGGEPVN